MLIIVTPFCRGTGVLISPTLVVTAGHVVQPYQQALTELAQITLHATSGAVIRPIAVLAHRAWSTGFHRAADMALLQLGHPLDDLVTPIVDDAEADARDVSIAGFALGGAEITNTGRVTRMPGDGGLDVFITSDLAFPDGVSGGPILDDDQAALGIATWSPDVAAPSSFVGIPFLDSTLGWLRANL